jgi:hypothetical protein
VASGGLVPGGENLKVVRGGCPEVCRSPVGGWRDRSWWPGVHQSEPVRRQRCVLYLCVFPCRLWGLPLFRRVLCLLRKSHVCVRVPRLEVALASDSRPDFLRGGDVLSWWTIARRRWSRSGSRAALELGGQWRWGVAAVLGKGRGRKAHIAPAPHRREVGGLRPGSWCTPVNRCARGTTATWVGQPRAGMAASLAADSQGAVGAGALWERNGLTPHHFPALCPQQGSDTAV